MHAYLVSSTYSTARNCENITAKSIVEQSGLSFEMSSTKHFHIIQIKMVTHIYKRGKNGPLSENDRKLSVRFARKMKLPVAKNPQFGQMNRSVFFI